MGAYNTVKIRWQEPGTANEYDLTVQFKYGEVWQHEYRIGDSLKWGANEVGSPEAKKVVAEGVLEGDKLSPTMPEDFEIYIVDNVIQRVIPSTHQYDFPRTEEDYVVLE
jgi:hypothetical protein